MNYDKHVSDVVKNIRPSGIRKFFDVAAMYKDVISLGVGEPDFVTPWEAREAAVQSIRKGITQYTSNSGLLQLREAVSRYIDLHFGIKYDPKDEIVMTVGASEAIYLAVRTLANAGDEVIIPEPSYVSYAPGVAFCDAVPVIAPCRVEDNFTLTAEALESVITPRTKALILPFPNNPTGAIMNREQLESIAAVIKKHDIIVISDEIYAERTYGDERHARRYERKDGADKRFQQGVCHDGLATRLRLRSERTRKADAEDTSIYYNVRADSRSVCRAQCAEYCV